MHRIVDYAARGGELAMLNGASGMRSRLQKLETAKFHRW